MTKVKMTAEQARQFNVYGKYSVATILANRKCNCDPYTDWFTFKRWLAQGKCVNKGEHGIKLTVFTPDEVVDDDGNVKYIGKRFYTVWVFCRCQVHDLDSNIKPEANTNKAADTIPAANNNPDIESFLNDLLSANVSSKR